MTRLRHAPHVVYRMYDAEGDLLYVGCTSDIGRRTAEHSTGREWFGSVVRIEVDHHIDQATALAREAELIRSLHPKHQISFSKRSLNGWDRRRRVRDEAHARSEPCQEWNCKKCVTQFGPKSQRANREALQ